MFAAAGALMLSPLLAQAQDYGRWFSGPGEFAEYSAWVSERSGNDFQEMEVLCAADVPYVNFSTTGVFQEQRAAQVTLVVNGQRFVGEGRYRDRGATSDWAVVGTPAMISALKSGSRVEASVDGQSASFGLRGSLRAIEGALAGCGTGDGYHKDRTAFFLFPVPDGSGMTRYVDTLPVEGAPPDAPEASLSTAAVSPPAAPRGTAASAGPGVRIGASGVPIAPSAGSAVSVAVPEGAADASGPRPDPSAEATVPPGPASQPPSVDGPVTMETLVARAADACMSAPVFLSDPVQAGDFDGDGRSDTIFNWSKVTCPSAETAMVQIGGGMCGMQNCAVDVYLSSIYEPGGWPVTIYSHQEIPPQIIQRDAGTAIRTQTSGGSCPFAEVCTHVWQWNGSELIVVE